MPVAASVIESSGTTTPENSELLKIGQDVLDEAKYALVSVASEPDAEVRPGSLEDAFREGLQRLADDKRNEFRGRAEALTGAPTEVRKAMFGRYGEFGPRDLLSGASQSLPDLQLDKKLLGVKSATLEVPIDALQQTPEGGLLLPARAVPAGLSQLDGLTSLTAGFEQDREEAARSGVQDDQRLNELWGMDTRSEPDGSGSEPGAASFGDLGIMNRLPMIPHFPFPTQPRSPTDKLGFYITQVKCVDETNPEWWGSDEIALAGVSVDETGDTKKIGETRIGGGFDDGDTKNYSPHWRFTYFGLREEHGHAGAKWPKMYFVNLLLAEKDHGGLSSAMDKVWKKIGDRVKELIAKAVASATGTLVGPAIAAAIGKVAAWVVGKLVEWIISLAKDDIFPPHAAKLQLSGLDATWAGGSKTGPLQTAHFSGHGGKYMVKYYWKMYA